MTAKRFALSLALIAAGVAPAGAQGADDFGALEFGVGGAFQSTRAFAGEWDPTLAASARVATPYHGGLVYMVLRADANYSRRPELPDFYAIGGAAGWGPVVALPAELRLLPSVHLGVIAFRFDDEGQFEGALRNESEITLGAAARVDVPVAGPFRAWAGVDVVRVFSNPRELLVFGEAGVSVSVSSPDWLRRGLR